MIIKMEQVKFVFLIKKGIEKLVMDKTGTITN